MRVASRPTLEHATSAQAMSGKTNTDLIEVPATLVSNKQHWVLHDDAYETILRISPVSLHPLDCFTCSSRGRPPNRRKTKTPRLLRGGASYLVELSGCCPPSPKSLTGAFSRLSFDFDLIDRTPQSGAYRSPQIRFLARVSDQERVPARLVGGNTRVARAHPLGSVANLV